MRTIESRRFSGPAGAVLWLHLVIEDGRLPYRVRLKHNGRAGGALAAAATEEEGRAALDRESERARANGWSEAPRRLRLALEIPTCAPKSPKPCPTDHAALARIPAPAPGHVLVCPDCGQEVRR